MKHVGVEEDRDGHARRGGSAPGCQKKRLPNLFHSYLSTKHHTCLHDRFCFFRLPYPPGAILAPELAGGQVDALSSARVCTCASLEMISAGTRAIASIPAVTCRSIGWKL